MDPNVAFILLAIGALALYAEFNHPGAVIPGTVGVVFILLAAFALNLLPVRFAAIAMIVGSLCPVRRRSQVREPRCAHHRRDCLVDAGRPYSWSMRRFPKCASTSQTALAVSIPLGLITAFLMSIAVRAAATRWLPENKD